MNIEIIEQNGIKATIVSEGALSIGNAGDALDLMMTVRYESGCDNIILPKSAFSEDFFKLSTGLAGEILQKFVNYRMRIAIVGDFSQYTSKPLRDFMYECNNGGHIYFAASGDEAAAALCK